MAQLSLFAGRRQRGKSPPPEPELNLQCAVADILDRWGTRGWKFTHLPMGERRNVITGARLKRMGTKRGWPDFILLSPYPSRAHFLELKRLGAKLTDEQQEFQWFCVANEIPYAMADSLKDAMAALKDWGAVRAKVSA
jgi:hypothetical protein